ncbi:MAG: phage major capsid protein [Streptosporangiaceae bacterium]
MTADTAAVPQTPEEFEEWLGDTTRLGAALQDGSFPGMVKDYVAKFTSKSDEVVREFREQMQLGLQGFMQDQAATGARPPEGWRPGMGLVPAQGRGPRRAQAIARSKMRDAADLFDRQGLYSATAVGAAKDIDEASYADSLVKFVWATLKGEHVAKQNGAGELFDRLQSFKGILAKALEIKNAGMSEGIPSEGGFLVPETLRSDILALSLEDAVMRPEATVIPMDSLRVPIPSIDDTSHTSSVFGGVSAFWTAEGAALEISAPKFSRVLLTANKLTAFTQIPNELLQDSVSPMDVWFRTFFPQAISFFEDLGFIVGDGVNQPEGLLNCPGAVTVDPAVSAKIALTDVIAMLTRLWPPSLKRARWLCSPDAFAQILGLGLVVGSTAVAPPAMLGGMQAIEMPAGLQADGITFRMFGIPGRVSEKVPYPGSGTDGALTLYDPSYYLIGDRQAMQIASSADYSFANDTVSYRVIERLDGRGWLRTALTPANGSSSTLSPFVKLGDTHT